MEWYLAVLKKYGTFTGRARRKEYWMFFLVNLVAYIALAIIDGLTGTFSAESGVGLLGAIYTLALLIPNLALTARRLHDTDRSAWWMLICLIPIIGAIVLLVFMCLQGSAGDNRFGEDPKASPSSTPGVLA
ncbi:Inner membrane protein YhaH [compost metagenome]